MNRTGPPEAAWGRHRDPAGRFELDLPPGVELRPDPAAPPGEIYLVHSPRSGGGTFSILAAPEAGGGGPAAGLTSAGLLALERELNGGVEVELDAPIEIGGIEAHQVRYRVTERQPSHLVRGDDPGFVDHRPASETVRLGVFRFVAFGGLAIRVGYRVDLAAPAEVRDAFDRMLESFRVGPG
jgi:hypothetical protein